MALQLRSQADDGGDVPAERPTKINKVTMEGFKSFQRKTAVPFFEGLTAIVGTNGSGKSNIQEAVQFVMGRRSSHLRAEKMEQLIFNGGDNRTPAEKAEVTLYLDNSTGAFDKLLEEQDEDPGADEITIGRKIKRNGYSTYRFMGSNCKRSVIDEVMERSNIEDGGYHIVRQGSITEIVKETPVERRKAIDRISGIASYDARKNEALEEMEQCEDELRELQIKLDMKQERLEKLETEKEAAEKYQNQQEKKARIEKAILLERKESLEKQIDTLEVGEGEELDELEETLEEHDARIDELETRREEIEDEIEEGQDNEVRRDIEALKGKIQRKKDKIKNNKDKIADLKDMLKEYQSMQRNTAGGPKAVKAVMNMGKAGVYGTVADLLHYNDRFAVAIEEAAGGRLYNIVVDKQDTAVECIDHLKSKSLGRATFLPLDKVSPRSKGRDAKQAIKQPGVIDYAINLVDYDTDYARAIKHVFGDTLVAEDLQSLKGAGKVRAVTLDGDIMRKGGSITGGAKKTKRKSKKRRNSFNPEKKKEEKEQLQQEIAEYQTEIEDMKTLLKEKKADAEEQSEVSEELKQERSETREELKELKQKRKSVAEDLETKRSKYGRNEKKKVKWEAELENIEEDLQEYDDIDEDDLGEWQDKSLDALKRAKTKAINTMNGLGNVNLRAIEEYEEFKEEFDVFKEKVEEIRQEKRELEAIIEEIEKHKRQQFMATLNEINERFNDIFTTLFEGGSAELELEDDDDLDSGLLIRAEPPGKDPHLIDALSGGEKTLTAISFLFALQDYNPSPFYVLDEIDAALDDKNAKRLSNLLRDHSEENQFIVISHRNETIRHADRAYGVSMTEGVSQVRSVDLEMDAENAAS